MSVKRLVLACVFAAAVSACGQSKSNSETNRITAPTLVPSPASTSPTSVPHPAPSPSPANYAEKEGKTYFYVSAVSEEDQGKGKALGEVLPFRYRGEVEGVHTLELLGDEGRTLVTYECPTTCRIIKRRVGAKVERIPYERSSVIGSAFEDALSGRLLVASSKLRLATSTEDAIAASSSPSPAVAIPTAFRGEWNSDLAACGTGLNDSRLRIEPRQVRFYESDAAVTRLEQPSPRALRVTASFAGEGETWTDSFTLVLSRSGDELTIEGASRSRCPR